MNSALTVQQSFAPWAMKAAGRADLPVRQAEQQLSPTKNAPIYQIIQPGARDRWLGQVARSFDPARIEIVLRSAMTGNLVSQWELFDLMEDTSPRIKKNLNKRKRAVMSYVRSFEGWHEEDEPATPEADLRARLVSKALWTMRPRADENQNGFDDTIYDILDAIGKGISLIEVDWEVREAGKLGLITAPQCTRWIHPRFYGYGAQADWLGLNVNEINSAVAALGREPESGGLPTAATLKAVDGTYARLPENKFLVCVYKTKSGHPIGGALLRSLAFWWCAANFTQEWFLNFAQIFGLPIRWANYDPNVPGLVDKICDMLENMGSAAWAAFPAGTTLELKEPMKAGTDNPQVAILDRADKQYDILILGQSGTTEVAGPGQSGGSYAANKVLQGVEQEIVESDATFIENVLNTQLIPAIIRLNYGDDQLLPEICLEAYAEEDKKAVADMFQVASSIGVEIPKDYAHKRLEIPQAGEGEETLEPRQPASPFGTGSAGIPAGSSGDYNLDDLTRGVSARAKAQNAATEKLIANTLEDLTGVSEQWLGGVKPFFHRLIALAESDRVTDADFVEALAKAQREIPELFGKLKPEALAESLERAMASAVVNGAVRGSLQRRR